MTDCRVTDIDHKMEDEKFVVTGLRCLRAGQTEEITVHDGNSCSSKTVR